MKGKGTRGGGGEQTNTMKDCEFEPHVHGQANIVTCRSAHRASACVTGINNRHTIMRVSSPSEVPARNAVVTSRIA